MSCMISLHLRDSAKDLETHSHPSHKAWFNSLKILRDFRQERQPWINNDCFCFVDQDDPRKAFFLYERTSDEEFHALKTACESEKSELNQHLSPLLKDPLGVDSARRLSHELDIFARYEETRKDVEFISLYNTAKGRGPLLSWLHHPLEGCMPPPSRCGIVPTSLGPIGNFYSSSWSLSNGDTVKFACFQWNGIQGREEAFSREETRQMMKSILRSPPFKIPLEEILPPFLESLGKTEESQLTWEEDLRLYIACEGAERIERQVMDGIKLTDKYFDRDGKPEVKPEEKKKRKFPCLIL